MTISAGIANTYKSEVQKGVHTATDTYMIALYMSSASIDPTTTSYTTSGEVTGSGYSPGGIVLTNPVFTLDVDTGVLTFDNPSWLSSTITARGALIYNSTKGNKAIVVLDFGTDIISTSGPFTVFLPAANRTTGIVRIQ